GIAGNYGCRSARIRACQIRDQPDPDLSARGVRGQVHSAKRISVDGEVAGFDPAVEVGEDRVSVRPQCCGSGDRESRGTRHRNGGPKRVQVGEVHFVRLHLEPDVAKLEITGWVGKGTGCPYDGGTRGYP